MLTNSVASGRCQSMTQSMNCPKTDSSAGLNLNYQVMPLYVSIVAWRQSQELHVRSACHLCRLKVAMSSRGVRTANGQLELDDSTSRWQAWETGCMCLRADVMSYRSRHCLKRFTEDCPTLRDLGFVEHGNILVRFQFPLIILQPMDLI